MKFAYNNIHDYANSIVDEIARQKEKTLMAQLNWLVSRGILLIESQGPTLCKTYLKPAEDGYELTIEESIILVVKDKEYIEKLENENKELNKRLQNIMEAMSNVEKS